MASPFVEALNPNIFDWQAIAVAAASLSVLASVMLIMISRLFDLKNLEQTAKTEFVYAASTVFIVIFALLLINMGESSMLLVTKHLYAQTLCVPPSNLQGLTILDVDKKPITSMIDYAKLYMYTPADCTKKLLKVLYILSIPVETIASIYLEIFMSEHASGFGIKWIAERINNTTQIMTFYMFMYYLMIHLMDFIKFYGGLFFAIGVALRAFPPLRGAGAYMMAISIGLYFIFPTSYILVVAMSLPQIQPDFECGKLEASGATKPVCTLPYVADVGSCGAEKLSFSLEMKAKFNANREKLTSLLDYQVFDLVRHLTASICLFPLICMTIVLTFVLNTTNLFGGNIPEIGRGLVKLI